jgi:hypothetical protein
VASKKAHAIDEVIAMTMPNPSRPETWIDHSKSTGRMGVDIEDQHFGFAQVFPLGFGDFDLHFSCENGRAGSEIHARFTVEFLGDDAVVTSLSHDFNLIRPWPSSGNMVQEDTERLQLSQDQLGQIKRVRLLGTKLP